MGGGGTNILVHENGGGQNLNLYMSGLDWYGEHNFRKRGNPPPTHKLWPLPLAPQHSCIVVKMYFS